MIKTPITPANADLLLEEVKPQSDLSVRHVAIQQAVQDAVRGCTQSQHNLPPRQQTSESPEAKSLDAK